jgi:hypothetical protein
VALVDFGQRELTLTVVYFGPLGAGCGTNVRQLHRAQPARGHVELRRIGDSERKDRIWHFSTSLEGELLAGWTVRLRVASVPGGPEVTLDRSAFLSAADGVIFVADARAGRAEDNLSALHDLEASLLAHANDLRSLPLTFQVNQTDAPNARPTARVLEDLDVHGAPHIEALARQGRGVVETFDRMRALVIGRLQESLAEGPATLPLLAAPAAERAADEAVAVAHAAGVAPMRGTPNRHTEEAIVECGPLEGVRALQIVRTELRGADVRIELLVRSSLQTATVPTGGNTGPVARPTGAGMEGAARRTAIVLRAAQASGTGPAQAATAPHQRQSWGRPAQPPPPPRERDLPSVVYGGLGILAGVITGYLLGFVVYG